MDSDLIKQFEAKELELRKQLEEAQAKNERLELEMQYKDKVTGLWNRKYIDKIINDATIDATNADLAVICTGVNNLKDVNERDGANAGDELLRQIADGLQNLFGQDAICCKLVGTKMCAFVTVAAEELAQMINSYEVFTKTMMDTNNIIEISFGVAKLADHPNMDVNGLLKEAEYDMHMNALGDSEENTGEVAPSPIRRRPGFGATILMIDDSMIILKTLQMMVKDKYKVLMSTSGMEGYEIAKEKRPDIILLDYNMPVVDGERILQLLRKSDKTKDIPVVFVTSVSETNKVLQIAQYKPAGYLLKPVAKDDLLKVLNKVLGD